MLLTNSSPGSPKVYRLRPGVTLDSDGDPVESWDLPQRTRIPRAEIQESHTEEDERGVRHVIKGARRLFIPGRFDLTAEDRIEVGANVWRIDGDPYHRRGFASGEYVSALLTGTRVT